MSAQLITREIQSSKPRYRFSYASARWLPACARSQHIGTMLISTHRGRAVIHASNNGGYKTSAAYVAEALGGRWSHRVHGYVMSSRSRADAAARLLAAGWSGCAFARALVPPKSRDWSAAELPRGARVAS